MPSERPGQRSVGGGGAFICASRLSQALTRSLEARLRETNPQSKQEKWGRHGQPPLDVRQVWVPSVIRAARKRPDRGGSERAGAGAAFTPGCVRAAGVRAQGRGVTIRELS